MIKHENSLIIDPCALSALKVKEDFYEREDHHGVRKAKRGCGKTTLCMQLAGAFAHSGLRTLVIDMDPQGTALRWASAAPDDQPFAATVTSLSAMGGKMHREVKNHVDTYDVILIDCPQRWTLQRPPVPYSFPIWHSFLWFRTGRHLGSRECGSVGSQRRSNQRCSANLYRAQYGSATNGLGSGICMR